MAILLPSPSPCAEVELSLTGDGAMEWNYGSVGMVGRAALVVCKSQEASLLARRKPLLDELSKIVDRNSFGMMGVCRPESMSAAAAVRYRIAHTQMITRFNAVLGEPLVRGVKCSFGWRHYEDGKLVSGVGQ